uniref:Transmembrane protein 14A n=1 Tax=Equus asinus TaxID=9793 RepID=A0A9L0JDJ6_EQUAS
MLPHPAPPRPRLKAGGQQCRNPEGVQKRGRESLGGVPSLIAGLFVGFLAAYGAYRVSSDKRDVKLSLFTAFFLATIMGVRFKRSKKIMPAGLVAGLSLLMILRLVFLLL